MLNPYDGINWGTIQRVASCSHAHCETQGQFNIFSADGGLQHYAISNYYPSKPCYPLEDVYTVPEGILSSPNAEHVKMYVPGAVSDHYTHINGLGSFFESGGEYPEGCNNENIYKIISNILKDLQFADGGGVTINHPAYSQLTGENLCSFLDADDRVLGVEIYSTDQVTFDALFEQNVAIWDYALKTGRRCWCFCVSDHCGQTYTNWRGRNILLVNEFTERACLKAYRDGNFYGKLKNSDLDFSFIGVYENTYTVTAPNADHINIIIDGVSEEYDSTSVSVEIPETATYIRAEAWSSDEEDAIFTNPVMLKERDRNYKNTKRMILLYS